MLLRPVRFKISMFDILETSLKHMITSLDLSEDTQKIMYFTAKISLKYLHSSKHMFDRRK